jgi:hypothetical protein
MEESNPMYDLAVLFGNIGGLVRRQQMAEGYRDAVERFATTC